MCMTECNFELHIHRVITDSIFKLQIYHPNYNHSFSENHQQHAQYRCSTDTEMTSIKALSAFSVASHFILDSLLETDSDSCVTTHEILNYKAKLHHERLAD